MKKLFLLLAIISCLGCVKKEINPTNIDEEIRLLAKTHLTFGRMPGMAIGIINNGTQKNYFYGVKDLSTGAAIDQFTLFQVASITKTFTAILQAELIVNDSLALTDRANLYLPSHLQIPDSPSQPVTVKALLNHTSGLEREPEEVEATSYYQFNETNMGNYLGQTSLASNPGATYSYSNTGFGLAGHMAGRFYQTNYKTAVDQRIFDAVGMYNTACDWNDLPSDNIATDYFGNEQAHYENYSEVLGGAYAVKSNLHDMMLYLDVVMNHENSFLNEAIALTLQPTFTIPLSAGASEVKRKEIGLAWHIITLNSGKQYIFHNGALKGSASFIGFNPETKEGVVVLINSFCPGMEQDRIGVEILRLLDRY